MSTVSSDNKRSDEYWMGVRDALRMIDIFNKWAVRNPTRAKSLEDFINDGLIAAAKRCESCLREKLGISFLKEEPAEDVPPLVESPAPEPAAPPDFESAPDEIFDAHSESPPDTDFEVAVESVDYSSEQEIHIESEEPTISIDTVERLEEEPMDDIVIEGPQRDFSTDFVLVEPSPLSVDADEIEPERPEVDESLRESDLEELVHSDELDLEPEDDESRPTFTWADYEAAITPAPEPEPLESDSVESTIREGDYEVPPIEDRSSPDDEAFGGPPEPSEAPKGWSTYDESAIASEEIPDESYDTKDEVEMDDSEVSKPSEAATPVTEPPSPPPPPETEEDEEERRRRARRLFFGT